MILFTNKFILFYVPQIFGLLVQVIIDKGCNLVVSSNDGKVNCSHGEFLISE